MLCFFHNLFSPRNRLNKRRRKSKLRKLTADTSEVDMSSVDVGDSRDKERSEALRRIRVTSGPRCTSTPAQNSTSTVVSGDPSENAEALRRIRVTPGPQCSPLITVTSSVIDPERNNEDEGSDAPRRIRITSGPRCMEFTHLSKKSFYEDFSPWGKPQSIC